MKAHRLTIELCPKTCWFSNVRSAISNGQWTYLSNKVRSDAYDVCRVCLAEARDCHEVWFYDDHNLVRKLIGLRALCKNCHMVKHIGYAEVQGKGERALRHFMKVNDMTRADARAAIKKSFYVWEQRSKKLWALDISLLNDYGIDVSKVKGRK